jgi:hypothetical protein
MLGKDSMVPSFALFIFLGASAQLLRRARPGAPSRSRWSRMPVTESTWHGHDPTLSPQARTASAPAGWPPPGRAAARPEAAASAASESGVTVPVAPGGTVTVRRTQRCVDLAPARSRY